MFSGLTGRFSAVHAVRSGLSRARRRVLLHRRWLAALAAGVAVYIGVQAAMAPAPETVPVWTVAHDLTAGDVLSRDDLRQVPFLPASVPADHVTDLRDSLGRPLAHAVSQGQVLIDGIVLGERWLADQEGGTVLPVRISDPDVVNLLRAGDTVDLLGTDVSSPSAMATTLAKGVRVVTIPRTDRESSHELGPGRLVLLRIPPQSVEKVATAAASHFLSVAWND